MVRLQNKPRVPQGPVIYVEGGSRGELRDEARRAFKILFQQLGLPMMPTVLPCGSRRAAYEKFCEQLAKIRNQVHLMQILAP